MLVYECKVTGHAAPDPRPEEDCSLVPHSLCLARQNNLCGHGHDAGISFESARKSMPQSAGLRSAL